MQDWLKLMGTYDPGPDNTTGYPYVIKTNDKSLVVRTSKIYQTCALSLNVDSLDLIPFRSPSSLLVPSSVPSLPTPSPRLSGANGVWSSPAQSSLFGVGLQLDTVWRTFVVGRVIAGLGGMSSILIFRRSGSLPDLFALLIHASSHLEISDR